ncbi:hypothetical protein [Helicobacter himalayensis]|uniref:hypothetical protein n=1 Tax=Helicobacter himalayensis TaxID=1591088 RepID=UPI0012E90B33|nr:hypothetical protein [Helicobacter himalayensis]
MHKKIQDFLSKQYTLHLSVCASFQDSKLNKDCKSKKKCESSGDSSVQIPYTACCFYAFDASEYALIFKSDSETKHIIYAKNAPIVGVSIAYSSLKITHIKGAQIRAEFLSATQSQEELYYKKFPFAKAHQGSLWQLRIVWLKYTDNTLFGAKKMEFVREKN